MHFLDLRRPKERQWFRPQGGLHPANDNDRSWRRPDQIDNYRVEAAFTSGDYGFPKDTRLAVKDKFDQLYSVEGTEAQATFRGT